MTGTLKNKKIAIVGGGPGGLTLARLLQINGADVKVFERDINENSRAKGATLDLHEESGLKALHGAGLMEAFMANYRPDADRMRITNKNAVVVFDDHNKEDKNAGRPEIDRGPLQKILLDSLLPDTIVWNSHILSLSRLNNETLKLEFENGQTGVFDLVIAADGANSKIRPYITPIKPFYSGVTVVEGAIYDSANSCPEIHQLLNGGKIFAFGDEKSLIVSSKGDGSLVFYTGCKIPENWSRECGIDFSDRMQVLAWFKKEYEGWDKIWQELFENASVAFIPRPQYCMPFDQNWDSLTNLTMLGDAAHLMPPYAGEGVNMAMLDALELSQCLISEEFTDLQQAISAYEKQMLARVSETAKNTMDSTDALHSPDAISFMLDILQ